MRALFLILAAFLSHSASAYTVTNPTTTPVAYRGVCYENALKAVEAYTAQTGEFAMVNNVPVRVVYSLNSLVGSTVDAVVYTNVATSYQFAFPPCTMTATVFDPALAGGLWMFGITIVLACYLIAKNIGLILEAIKRW